MLITLANSFPRAYADELFGSDTNFALEKARLAVRVGFEFLATPLSLLCWRFLCWRFLCTLFTKIFTSDLLEH